MATKPHYILTSNGPIAVYFGTVTKTVARNDPNFPKLIEMLRESHPASTEEILTFLDPEQRVKRHACGLFDVCNGGVYINGERTPDLFAKRALEIVDLGLNVKPLLALWANIKMNPDPTAVKDLYTFLDRRQHPITDDGCFIAYKRVRDNFTDHYTGTIDNSVGASPSMPRNDVDCNPKNTCSRGLHVASLEYARDQYQSGCGVLIAIKVHPKNVCAIPPDYNMTKMRTCGYDVLEVMVDTSKPIVKPVYNAGVDNQAEAQKTPEDKPLFVVGDQEVADTVGATVLRQDGAERIRVNTPVRRATDTNHMRQKRDAFGRFIPKH